MKKKKGLFISLEGGEGSGKSTQVRLLKNYLQRRGYQVIATLEPGGTVIGNQIRRILLSPSNNTMVPLTELFLYLASRAQIVQEIIKPALYQGKIVICDRYADSSVAYQGVARKLGIEFVQQLNRIATDNLQPDITFFLDIEPKLGLARKIRHSYGHVDRLEKELLAFHRLVRKGYIKLAKNEPARIKVISVTQNLTPKDIFQLMKRELDILLGET
ncbi:MAG: dTMP kinase [bacterium]|nr:dTMP kinase [bacterium]